ncbi:serine/arginine-rich splicing factor 11-like protein [Blastocystis sp. ATCC 50177/Nand II]|uniref:Serine/arginine-rich splicing factor 11-like protein n=1 Tax=Blastocystis sp. subtype 1 (strain ATCC 50177 / NandII) TaxID=478820 RepID=A0A196SG35_BLAHN|nr:serine/arginine-rich splicing factor 11-like protein [Blastocystis sp. ATCC 50177/Nand II]
MADPSAYNEISKINPQLAGAIYQYNTISSSMPAEKVDPMLLQQNAFQEQIGRTVYVGNLNPKIVEDQLIKVFGTCGIINLAKVAQEGMGLKPDAGTRFGFIEFQTRAGAEAATKLDGILLGGRPIRVGLSNGPIIQPTAYGPGAATMRNRPPLYKVSAGGFVILDQNAEDTINKRIDNKLSSVLSRLNKKYGHTVLPSDQSFQDLHQKYEQIEKHLSALMEYCLRFMKTIEKTSSNRLKVSQGYCTFVSTQPLFEDEAVSQYKQYVTDLNALCERQHEATTKVVLEVLKKRVVVQITAFLKDGTADMESLYKKRSDIRLDYDSHLQKTGVYERKNAMEEAMRFHSKARHDNAMLNAFTAYLTRRMEEFVSLGLKLLLLCTTTMVACEFYLTKRQYDALCMMGTNLSEEDVFSITSELTTLVQKVTAGESIEKDIIAPLLEIDPHPPSEYPVYTSYDEWVKKGGEEALSPDAEEFVEGTEEGDLSFEEGALITVIRVDESDWWEGELDGKTGIFPSNYVEYDPS